MSLSLKLNFLKKKYYFQQKQQKRNKTEMTYYGFYSEKQERDHKKFFIYQTPSGEEIRVTEIRKTKNANQNFPDTVFLGEVGRFLRDVDILI